MNRIKIIQGGMGIGVSSKKLARAVSLQGGLGVVSGTGLATVFLRQLQDGDLSGDLRRALKHFPDAEVAESVLQKYFLPPGVRGFGPYPRHPMFSLRNSRALNQLMVVACFAEVFLAKEGHDGLVGINFLEKIVLGNLPGLYGAMLAGVDVVIMGAGIPREIPAVLDQFADHSSARLKVPVEGAGDADYFTDFSPQATLRVPMGPLKRPKFLPVVSSVTLAHHLAKKSSGRVDGFVIEYPSAGGHNAPPRGKMQLNSQGEPVYTSRDQVNLEDIRKLDLPFWLAGEFATAEKLAYALKMGAQGVQIGTAFAFCKESGIASEYRRSILARVRRGDTLDVRTDPRASPSGYPFKVVDHPGTMSSLELYKDRTRKCDLRYLRQAYLSPGGQVGYRCPSEPVHDYVRKGGDASDTEGRKCLCNGLTATVGLPQSQENGYSEPALITAGAELNALGRFLQGGKDDYSARDVLLSLQGGVEN